MAVEKKENVTKDGIEELNEYLDQKESEQVQTEVTKKENKIVKYGKIALYGLAFVAGAAVVAILSHLGDDKDEEPKSIEDLTDIDKVIEEAKKDPEIETVEF